MAIDHSIESHTNLTMPAKPLRATIGRLHVITDTNVQRRSTHAELAALAIEGGADTIQYRSKDPDIRTMIAEAERVAAVCRAHGVPLIVNDRVDVALAIGADGVHLGRGDMPVEIARRIVGEGMIVGATVRNREHLAEAVRGGADYAGLGPIFATSTKIVGVEPLGLAAVRDVSSASPIPIIAIAGIDLSNVRSVIAAGAHGVAVIGAICSAADVRAATQAMKRMLNAEV
jgi:thiamine-phosphate pyrophosphorylase